MKSNFKDEEPQKVTVQNKKKLKQTLIQENIPYALPFSKLIISENDMK